MNVEKAIHYTQSGPSSDMQHASPSARDVRPVWTQTQPWTALYGLLECATQTIQRQTHKYRLTYLGSSV